MAPDDTDRRVLAALLADGRADLLDVAERAGVPGTTARDSLKAMEESGVVRGFVPRIDYEAAGYGPTVLFRLQVADDRLETVTERLGDEPRLRTVYELTGSWNVLAIGTFDGGSELDAFSRQLLTDSDVRAVDASVVLDAPSDHAPLDPTEA